MNNEWIETYEAGLKSLLEILNSMQAWEYGVTPQGDRFQRTDVVEVINYQFSCGPELPGDWGSTETAKPSAILLFLPKTEAHAFKNLYAAAVKEAVEAWTPTDTYFGGMGGPGYIFCQERRIGVTDFLVALREKQAR